MNDYRPRAAGWRDARRRYFGKYPGKVLDNVDPLFLGRILAEVPAVPGALLNWAKPCVPYAGADVGFYAIPPIGANVWIEYEGGDPTYPIWAGCFWGEGEVPEPAVPTRKVFKTQSVTMVLDDLPEEGGFSVRCFPPAVTVPLTMTFDAKGITLNCPEATVSLTEETITLTVPEATITVDAESIEVAVPEATVTITAEAITAALAPVTVTASEEMVSVEAPEVKVTADVDVTGAVEIQGDVDVTGAVEIQGDLNVTGAAAVEGDTNVGGALTVEGETNIAGALTVEGETNIAGALTVEGDEAVAGVIEGVVVPPI